MSTKATPQQGRRPTLTLSGTGKTPATNKGGGANTISTNGHQLNPTSKIDNKKIEQQQQQQQVNPSSNAAEDKNNTQQVTTRKQSSNSGAESATNKKREKTPNCTGHGKSVPNTADNKVASQQQLSQLQSPKSDHKVKENCAVKEKEESVNMKPPVKEAEIVTKNKEQPQESKTIELPQKNKEVEPATTPKIVKEDRKCAGLNKVSSTISEKGEKSLCQDQEVTSVIEATKSNNEDAITESIEMEPPVNDSPSKSHKMDEVKQAPKATSTPGKGLSFKHIAKSIEASSKSEIQLAMKSDYKIGRPRNLNQISGRRSIRPMNDYSPRKFHNLEYRESYRRINTELDNSFSSMNVTVGSEVHNDSSFSFFGRGRKRERPTPAQPKNSEVSPPKKARLDFCSVVFSPITMLRNRFSKTNIQSSTPLKGNAKSQITDAKLLVCHTEVQNVSGVFVQEDLPSSAADAEAEANNALNDDDFSDGIADKDDVTLGKALSAEKSSGMVDGEAGDEMSDSFEYQDQQKNQDDDDDIEIKETLLNNMTDSSAEGTVIKNKRCVLM